MRIGLSGGGASVDKIIQHAERAEADGFTSIWYPGGLGGDPLIGIALAGRATSTIELGTAILQTYTAHPVLQAGRALAVAEAMGRPGFTLGIGPSHQPVIEDAFGLSFAHAGRHTEEYTKVLAPLLRGEGVSFDGEDFRVRAGRRPSPPAQPVSLMVSALAPRLLRVAGELTDGTILWMGNARAIEAHVAPRIRAAAEAAGRPAPRIVAGLPVAVCDDEAEARATADAAFSVYGTLVNYRRLLDHGGAAGPGAAAIVGDEKSVTAQIEDLFAAGATDFWAAPFPVGSDRSASRARTRALLASLVG
jgi:F420-dependent oxidoreductase-like protein